MKFETIIIINPTLEEEKIKETIDKIEKIINANGKITYKEVWGKRKLAYPVKKHTDGFYVDYDFLTDDYEFIDELNRIYDETEEIMKHLITKIED